MNIIVNADKNWAIGKNNSLLVRIPADMKYFRQMTESIVSRYTSVFPLPVTP